MSSMYTDTSLRDEIRRSFYPNPDNTSTPQLTPTHLANAHSANLFHPTQKKDDDDFYLSHRYPFLLQRLYQAVDAYLDTYNSNDFIYDRYPDYVSLHHMRDNLLQKNHPITELFLQGGCTLPWLNLLADSIISELLTKRRSNYRKPIGDASTTSVRSVLRS